MPKSSKTKAPKSVAVRPEDIKDPYRFHASDVETPPRTIGAILRRIGPGMILAASIVGSGELIASTTLGAEVGYVALWIILLSCIAKPALQAEIGRFTISTGKTGLQAFDMMPGPRWKVSWTVWMWAFMVFMTLFQVGAMFGGVGQVLTLIFPAVSVNIWVLVLMVVTLVLLLGGGYQRVEFGAVLMVGLFTVLTLMCAMLMAQQPQYFSWDRLGRGFHFELPGAGLTTAIAVFGITGVGASELFMYPYWCVEKGYARFAGPRDTTPSWRDRARGWIDVMHIDILVSMIIYTVSTVSFYLLGAGVLNAQGKIPNASEMIATLSEMYTRTLGEWSMPLFFLGAVAVLYSTIFAATAAHSRVYADMVCLLGRFAPDDYRARVRWRNRFTWFLTLVPVALYLGFQSPVWMVKAGGVAQALMLPVIAAGALILRHRHLPAETRPGAIITAGLWVAAILTIGTMGYYAILQAR